MSEYCLTLPVVLILSVMNASLLPVDGSEGLLRMELLKHKTDQWGGPIWRVIEVYEWWLTPRHCVRIPRGREVNLGTVPWCFRWFVSPVELREGSALHDFLCNERYGDDDNEVTKQKSGWSRWLADAILYEWCRRERKIGRLRSIAVWMAVRSAAIWNGENVYRDPLLADGDLEDKA